MQRAIICLTQRKQTGLEDYTKYLLKRREQLITLLENKDNLFIIACNKCFQEFKVDDGHVSDCAQFASLAADFGKTVSGCIEADFLCNKNLAGKYLQTTIPEQAENICVVACGYGAQTVAELAELPVYTVCDSVSSSGGGHHGMALTKHLCGACGQCYLNLTGGICPIVGCPKGLLNGQCGGSKDGKCETDKTKDCVWDKIHARLDAQGSAGILLSQPAQLRDYSKVDFGITHAYIESIREKRLEGFYGGLHLHSQKHFSQHMPIKRFPDPQTVIIPLLQHIGAPAKPIVTAGDYVKVSQKIGEAVGHISSSVHASVSGIVKTVEFRYYPNTGIDILSVVIESDGKNELHESVKPLEDWRDLSAEAVIAFIRDKGIVGMGGATFPTSVKLTPPKPVDTVLVNGCECEPLLTADYRVLLEYPDDVIFGLQALLKTAGAKKGIIAIEDDKSDAVDLLRLKTAAIAEIDVFAAKTKYPQGAEKTLIKRALDRSVPDGGFPFDVGVIVNNVSTAKAVSDAIQKGLPLIQRVLTVSGEKVKHPGNFMVKLGTPISEIIDYCGGAPDGAVIKLGGPMMGIKAVDLGAPVTKSVNGIIAVDQTRPNPSPCIKCGRCVDVCPMELLPLYFPFYAAKNDWEGMKAKDVVKCVECGCCDFICPSKIAIREAIKTGKKAIEAVDK